ncbi:MAG: 23S ribosomal RNA methyltransferase Erm [Chloroflexota bacterium]
MAHKPIKSRRLGQHFLRSQALAASLVRQSNLNKRDIVYEIGPGKGILTAPLAQHAHKVIAIEKDSALAKALSKRFKQAHNVQIIRGDFLRHRIQASKFKVFANIPYSITSAAVRKLLFQTGGLQTAHLIMQQEAAFKFIGMPHETQFSILAKARFQVTVERYLSRTDFDPPPKVDSLMLKICRRERDCVPAYDLYRQFVIFGFRSGKRSLKLTLKPFFTYKQWRILARELNFMTNARPSDLSFEQWVLLFKRFRELVPSEKRQLRSLRP